MARTSIITLFPASALHLTGIQSPSAEKPVAGEFAGFGGGTFFIGNRGVVGGSVGLGLKKRWVVFFEYSYIPMGISTAYSRGPMGRWEFQGVSHSRANDFSLAAHLNLSTSSPRVVPYVAGGIGRIAWSSHCSGTSTSRSPDGTITTEQTAWDEDISTTAFSFGGGVRWYLSDHWGLRPEIRVFSGMRTEICGQPDFGERQSFVRASIAIFYQTRAQSRTK